MSLSRASFIISFTFIPLKEIMSNINKVLLCFCCSQNIQKTLCQSVCTDGKFQNTFSIAVCQASKLCFLESQSELGQFNLVFPVWTKWIQLCVHIAVAVDTLCAFSWPCIIHQPVATALITFLKMPLILPLIFITKLIVCYLKVIYQKWTNAGSCEESAWRWQVTGPHARPLPSSSSHIWFRVAWRARHDFN